MAISSISVQQIVAVIQQQIVETVRSSSIGVSSLAPESVKKGAIKRTRPTGAKQANLSKMIGSRVSALAVADPDRGRKAFRIFLESVLLNELGEELINDPGFYQLVSDIQLQMESAPEIAKAIQVATEQLLSGNSATNNIQT